jgi:hypothetical protein
MPIVGRAPDSLPAHLGSAAGIREQSAVSAKPPDEDETPAGPCGAVRWSRLSGPPRRRLILILACAVSGAAIAAGLLARHHPAELPPLQPKNITVPRLVGERVGAAKHELWQLKLEPRFKPLGSNGTPCAGLPWTGRIIRQHPAPREVVNPHDDVFLETSCPRIVPSCEPYQLAMRAHGFASDYPGTAGQQIVAVDITHIAGPPCQIRSTLYVELLEEDGDVASWVDGSPATHSFDERTGIGEEISLYWFLAGYVHPPTRFTIQAQMGTWSSRGHVRTPFGYGHGAALSSGMPGYGTSRSYDVRSYKAAVQTTEAYGR